MEKTYSAFDITCLWQQQLMSQAAWYDFSKWKERKRVAKLLAEHFLTMQHLLGTSCFFEIGAHEATFSRRAKTLYPEATVFAFEANPYVYRNQYSDIIRDYPDIRYMHLAITDYNGTAFLNVCESISGVAEALDGKRHSLLKRKDSDKTYCIEIPCANLSSIVEQNDLRGLPSCLWIDVEGASAQVLAGAETILPQVTSLYIEIELNEYWEGQQKDTKIFDYLLEHDFIPVLRDFEYRFQYNVIWIKKDLFSKIDNHNAMYIQRCIKEKMRG